MFCGRYHHFDGSSWMDCAYTVRFDLYDWQQELAACVSNLMLLLFFSQLPTSNNRTYSTDSSQCVDDCQLQPIVLNHSLALTIGICLLIKKRKSKTIVINILSIWLIPNNRYHMVVLLRFTVTKITIFEQEKLNWAKIKYKIGKPPQIYNRNDNSCGK